MLPKDFTGDDRSQKAIKIYLMGRDTKMFPKDFTADDRSQKAIKIYLIRRDTKMFPKDFTGDDRSQKGIKIYLIYWDTKRSPKILTGDDRSQKAIMMYLIPPRPPSAHPLFQGSLITLIADLIPNLILLAAGLLMNPPGEVWVQDYGVKLEEGKMNELEK